jgi:predicted nucleic acid-binding protein
MVNVLLDTCVFSELRLPTCDPRVRAYMLSLDPKSTFLSVMTIGEITNGIELLPPGRKRGELQIWLEGLEHTYADRILPIDVDVARYWGELVAHSRQKGFQLHNSDGLIAATALKHGMHLITRNSKDFVHMELFVINPWQE